MEGSCAKRPEEGRNVQDPPDRAIAARARHQHGVVALWQLAEAGLSAGAARKRVAAGRLHRVHRGVFAVGHARMTPRGRLMAAVLACGPGAVISHRSAAGLWELRLRGGALTDVTAPGSAGRRRAQIRVHSAATLAGDDITEIDGVPCTTLARTLLDFAEDATHRELERALERAEILRLLDMREIDDVLGRADGRRGGATLRAVLSQARHASTITRSELEERLLEICRNTGLPHPQVNAWLPGLDIEADFLWRDRRLIAEVDGHATHATRRAFEADRARDQRLAVAGWRVVRFTYRQASHDAAGTATTLAALLRP